MGSDAEGEHEPVLLAEVMEWLAVKPGALYVDGTLGLGGHTREILARSAPEGRVIGVDRDEEALDRARLKLRDEESRLEFIHADYRDLPAELDARGLRPDGILLDLGIGSHQLDAPERGFSFRHDGPLDMRFDRSQGRTAADLVNRLPVKELADVLFFFGEERASRRIAHAIVDARRVRAFRTTAELAEVVRRAAPRSRRGLDPATRTFQALRIRVNGELDALGAAVQALCERLAPGGRFVAISFHSLEDREVKLALRELARGSYELLTRKPLRATQAEQQRNRRSRSARLRALERMEEAA